MIGSLLGDELSFEDTDYPKYATAGQAVFTASFNINRVFVDSVLVTTGYTGQGTKTITFDVGLSESQEVYLTT